jgi:CheY-like chemotaxis protein/HPt (histidine-containing phosphotransfer) domain-containing protein
MGGKIGVNSSPGIGSTFWIELPLSLDESVAEKSTNEPGTLREQSTFSGTVLLVDDNETNLMLGSMILEGMGISVLQANGGEVAVATALEEPVDLVLMDISMPEMDGYEATRLIRKERSADVMPVIALTAYASSEEREKSKLVGMNDYLTKPIERDRLADVLSKWLARRPEDGEAGDDDSAASEDLLDMLVIESLLQQIGRDNLNTVIKKFCTEASDRWQALESASCSADLAREAHTLASTCISFGLPLIAEKLQSIESAAKAGRTVESLEDAAAIGAMLEHGLYALQSRVRSLTH